MGARQSNEADDNNNNAGNGIDALHDRDFGDDDDDMDPLVVDETALLINPQEGGNYDDALDIPYQRLIAVDATRDMNNNNSNNNALFMPPMPLPSPANAAPYPQLTTQQLKNLMAQGLQPDLAFVPYQMKRVDNRTWLNQNTNIPRPTIECHNSCYIQRNTVELTIHYDNNSTQTQQQQQAMLGLQLRVDCNTASILTIYWFAQEQVDEDNNTVSIHTALYNNQAKQYRIQAGLNQLWSLPAGDRIGVLELTPHTLSFSLEKRYFPLIVQCQPAATDSKSKNTTRHQSSSSTAVSSRTQRQRDRTTDATSKQVQSLYTFCGIIRTVHHTYVLKTLQQKVNVDNRSYVVEEIYGMNDSHGHGNTHDVHADGSLSPRSTTSTSSALNHDCVICYSAPRSNVLLPCCHLCLCNDCGQAFKQQNTVKCPLCRSICESVIQLPLHVTRPNPRHHVIPVDQLTRLNLNDADTSPSQTPSPASHQTTQRAVTTSNNGSTQLHVRCIKPPKLAESNFKQKVLCHRPMRHGCPRIEVEVQHEKTILHHYCHGGSGWTLAPGSAKYAVDLLEKHFSSHKSSTSLTHGTPVAIVGAGVIGLFTALTLHQRGYKNIKVIAERYSELASHHAGGSWGLTTMSNDPHIEALIRRIGVDSYKFYSEIARKKHPILKRGARHMTEYCADRDDSEHEPFVRAGLMRPAVDVLLDFQNGTTRQMVAYDDGIFMSTPQLMHDLRAYLEKKAGVKFEQRKVHSLTNDVADSIIVNCTGLGAAELCGDANVVPVQGHLWMLADQEAGDIEYMISCGGTVDQADSARIGFIKRRTYMFPKVLLENEGKAGAIGVLGGTFIVGADERQPNEEQWEKIKEDARRFYGV